jgi:hypothetical protein
MGIAGIGDLRSITMTCKYLLLDEGVQIISNARSVQQEARCEKFEAFATPYRALDYEKPTGVLERANLQHGIRECCTKSLQPDTIIMYLVEGVEE